MLAYLFPLWLVCLQQILLLLLLLLLLLYKTLVNLIYKEKKKT